MLDNGAISLTFDDGRDCHLKNVVPILDDCGISGTFFVCGKYIDRSIYEWKEVAKKHEIGSHSFRHLQATKLTAEELMEDAVWSKDIIEKILKTNVVSYAYPYAVCTPDARVAVSKFYEQARGGLAHKTPVVVNGEFDFLDAPSYSIGGGNVHQAIALMEKVVERKGWLTFTMHGVGSDNTQFDNMSCEQFGLFMEAVKWFQRSGVWVASYREVAGKLRETEHA